MSFDDIDCSTPPFLDIKPLDKNSEILKNMYEEHIEDIIALKKYEQVPKKYERAQEKYEQVQKKYRTDLEHADNIFYAVGKGYAYLFESICNLFNRR